MTLPRTAAEVVASHVVFEVESIDRLYLNVYVPELQRVGQVVGFLTRHRGFDIASTALVAPMSEAFVKAIRRLAAGLPLVTWRHRFEEERWQGCTGSLIRIFSRARCGWCSRL